MPEALISRHDRDSPAEIALPFWSFRSCHFSSRFRNVARCCKLHLVSVYAVPGCCLDIFFRVIRHKEETRETQRQTTCPIYVFFSLASLLQLIFSDAQ